MPGAEEALLLCADERPAPVIIVRTHRLARLLLLRLAELRESAGRPVAERPDVLTIDQWVQRAWEQGSPREHLLSHDAELAAWESILAADEEVGDVLDLGAVAAECAEAWRLLHQWSEPDWAAESLSRESEAFLGWRAAFRERAAAGAWVTSAELSARVLAAFHDGSMPVPAKVVFVGFERFEPYVARLRGALEHAGTVLVDHEVGLASEAVPALRAFATIQDEARTIAGEIRELLAAQPAARVAVLAADMSRYRGILETTFLEELDPTSLLPGQEMRPRPFDLAGAPSLAEHAVIAHALDLLDLDAQASTRALLSRVLLAPYPRPRAGDEHVLDDELDARAMSEAALRRRNVASLPLQELAGRVAVGAPRFAEGLRKLVALLEKPRPDAAPGALVRRFIQRLQAMGWPGAGLEGDEAVAFARWRDVLGDLAALEVVAPVMSETQAKRRLLELCERTAVQSPSAGLQVQVMGLLDSAGLVFDQVYAVGMDSVSFPAALRPNALLPARWQREQRLPLASAEAELEFAGAVWRRVLRSGTRVHASYAISGGQDEMRSASSFVAALATSDAGAAALRADAPWYAAQAACALEPRPVQIAVPALVRSGSTELLVGHARCHFQAMANIRLAARALEAEQSEPAPNTRGTLVHEALRHVLPLVRSRAGLAACTDTAIDALAAEGAEAALASEKGAVIPEMLQCAARRWLREIVAAWLVYERDERSGEWTFEQAEQKLVATFDAGDGGPSVVVTCIVDRIDVTDAGRMLIDYKTGSALRNAGVWHGERPDDAQLPIYAAAVAAMLPDLPVAGLAFARIDTREKLELVGRCDDRQSAKFGPPTSRNTDHADWTCWSDSLDAMSAALAGLAVSFARGDAHVDPQHEASTCRNCRRQRLCRVFEGIADDNEENGAGEDDA